MKNAKRRRGADLQSVPRHLVLPAVRVLRTGQPSFLALWCPVCRCAHTHGDANPSAVWTGRGHHYTDARFQDAPVGYSLLVTGKVRSLRSLPRISLSEALALTELLSPLERGMTSDGLATVSSPPLVPLLDHCGPDGSRVLPAPPTSRDA